MSTQNLATCLAPALFYPSPSATRDLDPTILEPRKMADAFKFILEIWPDERMGPNPTPRPPPQVVGLSESWAPSHRPSFVAEDECRGARTRYSHPFSHQEPRFRDDIQPYPHYHPDQPLQPSLAYRSHRSSGTGGTIRSTLSGPVTVGKGDRSPRLGYRSVSVTGRPESGRAMWH